MDTRVGFPHLRVTSIRRTTPPSTASNSGNSTSASVPKAEPTVVVAEPKPVVDLWQEALENVKQSDEWKTNQEDFEDALNQCHLVNHNALTEDSAKESLADAISRRLSVISEKVTEKQWAYKVSDDRTVYMRDVVGRIVQYVDVFRDPVNAVVASDPTKASGVIWGFIQFFVGRIIESSETRDLAFDQELVAHLSSRYALVERHYIRQPHTGFDFSVTEELRRRLIDVYTAVLHYQFAVYRYLKQGKITHGIQNLIPSTLKEYSAKIESRAAEVDKLVPIANGELILNINEIVKPLSKIGGQVQQVLDLKRNMEHDHYSKVLEWVSRILHKDHHEQIKPLAETGEWLFKHPEFVSWRESRHSLVVSHLMKQARFEEHGHDEERVAFFYINKTNRAHEAGSVDLVLGSLLKQLTILSPSSLFQPVVAKYEEEHNSSSLRQGVCVSLLKSIILASRQISIVIDALDELGDIGLQTNLMEELKGLVESCEGTIVKIFITSRNEAGLAVLMDKYWQVRRNILIGEHNREDVARFIDMKVRQFFEETAFEETVLQGRYRKLLTTHLRDKSDGMFRWVDQSIAYLRQLKVIDLDNLVPTLDSVPPGLMEMYATAFQSMKSTQNPKGPDVLRRILTWIMYAQSDQVLAPAGETGGFHGTGPFLNAINYGYDGRHTNLTERDVLQMCSGFVTLDKTFGLTHLSVKEFLQERPEYTPEAGHAFLAASFVSYLNYTNKFQIFNRGHRVFHDFRDFQYCFRHYVAEYWAQHCGMAGCQRSKQPLASLLSYFWPRPERQDCTFTSCVYESRFLLFNGFDSVTVDRKPTPFFLACYYGLQEVVEAHLQNGYAIDQTTSSGLTGLFFACLGEQLDLISYLISHGAATSTRNEDYVSAFSSTISLACSGRPIIFNQLLEHASKNIAESDLSFCLSTPWSGAWGDSRKLRDRHEWRPSYVEETLAKLLMHMPTFRITGDMVRGMFYYGANVTRLLLEHDALFRLTDEALEDLVTHRDTPNEIIDLFEVLRAFGQSPLDQEQFHLALRTCEIRSNPVTMVDYFLALNPALSILQETEFAAMMNSTHDHVLIQHLLKLDMLITDDMVMKAMMDAREPAALLQLLFHHDNSPQVTLQHIQCAIELDRYNAPDIMRVLLQFNTHLNVPQGMVTAFLNSRCANRDVSEVLLSVASPVELTTGLLEQLDARGNNVALQAVIASNSPQNITRELVGAATERSWVTTKTLQDLLKRAPAAFTLPEPTIQRAYAEDHNLLQLIMERWPDVSPTETCLKKAVLDKRTFGVILDARPNLFLSEPVVLSACTEDEYNYAVYNSAAVIQMILHHQPDTAITEGMFKTVLRSSQPDILKALLLHDTSFSLSDDQILSAAQDVYLDCSILQVLFTQRPLLHLNPEFFVHCFIKARFDSTFLELALTESPVSDLGADLMLSLTTDCTPFVPSKLLARWPDAVVTEATIARVIWHVERANVHSEDTWLSDDAQDVFATFFGSLWNF
ncbi:hypothetical protein BJY04DRAFT_224039 [Aspergillus karnatakaensis]|uniref:uncharacterized protein n=1 Tax=Aspergillus karnatakaensis TaxID=1810916 RepID=UPI003CCCB5A3